MADKREILSKIDIPALCMQLVPSLKPSGDIFIGLCPFHDDHNPSLSVTREGYFKCFGCNKRGSVIDLCMKVWDTDFKGVMHELSKRAGIEPNVTEQKITGRYDYHDNNGNLLYWKVRLEPGKNGSKKEFRFYHGDGQKGRKYDAVLYNLPAVLKASEIIINEGEKKCDLCNSWGLTATTLDSGAQSSLKPKMVEQLSGKKIIILRDNGDEGLKYSNTLAKALHGKCESLKVILLPGLPEKGDICDWVREPGNNRERLVEIIGNSPEYAPQEQASETSGVIFSEIDGKPIPFIRKEEQPEPFPFEAFPKLILDALEEYAEYGQQPISMLATSVLAVLSLIAQGYVDIARDSCLRGPVSLNTCVIAESGERKTASDRHFKSSVIEWFKEYRKRFRSQIQSGKTERSVWEEKRKALLSRIGDLEKKSPAYGSEKANELEELKIQLAGLDSDEPPRIIEPTLFYGDTNPASLGDNLSSGFPVGSVWTNEGATVVGSDGMSDKNALLFLGMMNQLWDDGCYENKRKTTSSITIRNKRVSCNLMMQKQVFQRFVFGHKGLARGTGLMARFLICEPVSTIGKRIYKEPREGMPAKAAFDRRVLELLGDGPKLDDEGGIITKLLTLDHLAKNVWIDFYNDVESKSIQGSEFFEIRDYSSKTADNASRVAAGLHFFLYGPTGKISDDIMMRAARIALWFLEEERRIMGHYQRPQVEENAERLLLWLIEKGYTHKEFKAVELLQYAPNSLRNTKIRDAALNFLAEHKFIIANGSPLNRAILSLHPLAAEAL